MNKWLIKHLTPNQTYGVTALLITICIANIADTLWRML
jgi:hypothetical protein